MLRQKWRIFLSVATTFGIILRMEKRMRKQDEGGVVARLSSRGEFTSFAVGETVVRFRTSPKLVCYKKVLTWDNGYIEVLADYGSLGVLEEYIDLSPILRNLFIEPGRFLSPIKKVEVQDDFC